MAIELKYSGVRGESKGIPKLIFDFQAENTSNIDLGIIGGYAEIRIIASMNDHDISKSLFIGYALMEKQIGQFSKHTKQEWIINLPLYPYTLQKIEEMRKRGDLFMQAEFSCPSVSMQDNVTALTALSQAAVYTPGHTAPFCPFKVAQSDWEKILKDLEYEDIRSVEEDLQRARMRANEVSREMETILDKSKAASAMVGVGQHAGYFNDEASDHRKTSRRWLAGTLFLAVLGVAYSFWSFHQGAIIPDQGTIAWWPHLTYLTSRLLVLSVIFFGMGWSARNYRTNKHNEILNRHRNNALKTFETFVLACRDDATRDAVLLEATKSIFDAQTSGYLTGEPEKVPSGTVIEILKKVISTRGSS